MRFTDLPYRIITLILKDYFIVEYTPKMDNLKNWYGYFCRDYTRKIFYLFNCFISKDPQLYIPMTHVPKNCTIYRFKDISTNYKILEGTECSEITKAFKYHRCSPYVKYILSYSDNDLGNIKSKFDAFKKDQYKYIIIRNVTVNCKDKKYLKKNYNLKDKHFVEISGKHYIRKRTKICFYNISFRENLCKHCKKNTHCLFVCKKYIIAYYCSKKCQVDDWEKHKKFCAKMEKYIKRNNIKRNIKKHLMLKKF